MREDVERQSQETDIDDDFKKFGITRKLFSGKELAFDQYVNCQAIPSTYANELFDFREKMGQLEDLRQGLRGGIVIDFCCGSLASRMFSLATLIDFEIAQYIGVDKDWIAGDPEKEKDTLLSLFKSPPKTRDELVRRSLPGYLLESARFKELDCQVSAHDLQLERFQEIAGGMVGNKLFNDPDRIIFIRLDILDALRCLPSNSCHCEINGIDSAVTSHWGRNMIESVKKEILRITKVGGFKFGHGGCARGNTFLTDIKKDGSPDYPYYCGGVVVDKNTGVNGFKNIAVFRRF